MKIVRKFKRRCRACGGKGWKVDHALGIFTFGIGYLMQALGGKPSCDDDCPECGGRGYVVETEELEVVDD